MYPYFDLVWYLPGRLAGGMRPRHAADIARLVSSGIRTLVCLKESPCCFELCQMSGIVPVHLPVADFGVPDLDLLLQVQELLEQQFPLYLHCHAGLGRTGTVAAALCVFTAGMTPERALAWVRGLRPGSVETAEQEEFVRSLSKS